LAEFLDIPNVMHVIGLHWEASGKPIITQQIEYGHVKLEGSLPLAIAVKKELNKPRYIPFAGILAAESKEIQVLTARDLDIDPGLIGLDGSPTKMAGLEVRKFERARERLEGTGDEIVKALVDRMYQYGIL
jgi:electron transfer flavoprotein beta subunit